MAIDFNKLTKGTGSKYDTQIERVRFEKGYVTAIENTIQETLKNLSDGATRLAIYGEPQSGKTEMMICLSARLLDEGHTCIIILVNDSLDVLSQNYERFLDSNLIPTPRNLSDLAQGVDLYKAKEQIIITKKNPSDLLKLIEYLKTTKNQTRVVIDDEADHATPNAKVNKLIDKKTGEANPKTAINKLVGQLIELTGQKNGIYIGVTATPQRLDLNNTFDNQREHWVLFDTHPNYHGHEVFFPSIESGEYQVKFHLEALPDDGDSPEYLQNALLRFMINVAHLNCSLPDTPGAGQKNYCMLIHTSGTKEDHRGDYKEVVKVFEAIGQEKESKNLGRYFNKIESFANEMYPDDVLNIMQYIFDKCEAYTVKVINSERDRELEKITAVTDPKRPFTVAIGGNIISRGVTFDRLLTMFFTRSPKHKIQTDTYVQRARMFGSRSPYLDHFELHIPKSLYQDWHTAFYLHRLGMASLKTGDPIWYENDRTSAVASSSKDKANIFQDAGEVDFDIFVFNEEIDKFTSEAKLGYDSFAKLMEMLPSNYLPTQITKTIESMKPNGDQSIVIHKSRSIKNHTSLTPEDIAEIRRGNKGLFYGSDASRFPQSVHHFQIFNNPAGNGRMIYKYVEKGKGLKIISWRKKK
jgi:DNA polymerase III delta prime subunit